MPPGTPQRATADSVNGLRAKENGIRYTGIPNLLTVLQAAPDQIFEAAHLGKNIGGRSISLNDFA